jgi:hypothetical protein
MPVNRPVAARRLRALALAGLFAVLAVAAACGDDDGAAPTTEPPSTQPSTSEPEAPGEGDQRELTARIVEIYTASASIELDEVEVLSGEEAKQAAVDAGAIEPGEDLPNDVWIRDDSNATERFTVDPAAVVWIYDCSAGCERVEVELSAFLRNEVAPYGGDTAVWEVTLTDGMISSLLEVYLP